MTALLLAVVLAFVSSERLARWTPLVLVPLPGASPPRPRTAKLFHGSRHPCTMATEMPAVPM